MGLAAGQARLLTLQSRMHDLELQCMRYSNEEIVLTALSNNVAIKYNKMLEAANNIAVGYNTTYNTISGSSSNTYNTLKMNNGSSNVDFDYNMLKELGYDIAPAGTSARETVTEKTTEIAVAGGTYDKATGKWTMPRTVDEFAKLMMATGCANAYTTGSDNLSGSTLNMTKYLDENGNIKERGNANSPLYWANRFAKKPVAKEDASTNETTEIEFDEAKLTKLLGSAPVKAGKNQSTEKVVSYEYDTNDIIEEAKKNSQALIEALMSGNIAIYKNGVQVDLSSIGIQEVEETDGSESWTQTSTIQTIDTSARDAARQEARSYYDSETKKISMQEKALQIKSKQAETEYSAACTEYESAKSLVSDNAKRGFSIWS